VESATADWAEKRNRPEEGRREGKIFPILKREEKMNSNLNLNSKKCTSMIATLK
jgi:hypothetical protein